MAKKAYVSITIIPRPYTSRIFLPDLKWPLPLSKGEIVQAHNVGKYSNFAVKLRQRSKLVGAAKVSNAT